jgi:peptide/nickel transport system ATP-binding protein
VILADEPVSMVDASLRATILGALRQMTLDLQIPVIYITHDLATAYQIAENIIVLYRGAVVEAGDVELVVKDPRHPYTRLLVGSIPLPGTERTWTADSAPAPASPRPDAGAPGCLFEDRCPSAMPACRASAPPLYRSDPRRVVSCFLYRDAPALPPHEMPTVFVESSVDPRPGSARTPAAS